MPKTLLPRSKKTPPSPGFHSRHPWKCKHRSGNSEIAAFMETSETSGRWETVAVIQPTSGVPARALANFIADVVNDWRQQGEALDAAREALEMIVSVGVNFSTEEDAEAVIARIKKLRPSKKKSRQDPA